MFKNFIKTGFRNLIKQKFFTLVNISGLAVGIACCLLIILFVVDELSYDKHHLKADHIYRVKGEIKFGGNHFQLAVGPAPMAEALVNDFPEVEVATRFRRWGSYLVKKAGSEENFKEDRIIFSDPNVFEVFTIPFVSGDPSTALEDPQSLVLSASMAEKYFGDTEAVGKILNFDNSQDYQITGVYEDMPENSHFHFDFMLSMKGLEESQNPIWLSNNFNTYFVLTEGADPAALEAKLPAFFKKYAGPQIKQFTDATLEEMEASGQGAWYRLQPLRSIHLHSDLTGELGQNGDITYIYIFSAIALFILIIACINFMNLATARSSRRAHEVGVRKVLGSARSHLIGQFLSESVLLSIVSFALALIMAEVALPFFNELAGKDLMVPYGEWLFFPIYVGAIFIVGLMAGLYPAFFLSSFQPIAVLKGRLRGGLKRGWFRSGLVVFQFATSIVLIVGTLIIYQQLNFIRNKKLGFNKEQVIILHDAYALGEQVESFKQEMLAYPEVRSATSSSYLPTNGNRSDTSFWPEESQIDERAVSMQVWRADHDYVKTLGMEIVKGRDFSRDFPTDSAAVILNETAVRNFGFSDSTGIIGKQIATFNGPPGGENVDIISYTVIGVIKDFHFESLRENITSLGIFIDSSQGLMSFRVNTSEMSGVIGKLEAKWADFAPGQPFAYSFMDEEFENIYRNEQKLGTIFLVFAVLAIFVASLGLFALAAFIAEQRTKEIGIRKVLGASVANVILLLSSEFAVLVLVSLLVAVPVSWYIMDHWLESFAFRIEIEPLIFVLAGLLAMGIAMFTVSSQALKAALANPVDSLKEE